MPNLGERVGRGIPLRRWEAWLTLYLPTVGAGAMLGFFLLGQALVGILELAEGRSPLWVMADPLLALPLLGGVGLVGLWAAFAVPRERLRSNWVRGGIAAAILVGVGTDLYVLSLVVRFGLTPAYVLAYWLTILLLPLWAAARLGLGLLRPSSLPGAD